MLSRHHALSGYGALARGTYLQYPAQRSGRYTPAHNHECTMALVWLHVGAADSRLHLYAGSLLLPFFATPTMTGEITSSCLGLPKVAVHIYVAIGLEGDAFGL